MAAPNIVRYLLTCLLITHLGCSLDTSPVEPLDAASNVESKNQAEQDKIIMKLSANNSGLPSYIFKSSSLQIHLRTCFVLIYLQTFNNFLNNLEQLVPETNYLLV